MSLYIAQVKGAGRGVFTSKKIRKGSVIEVCPVIPLNAREWDIVSKTILNDYVFDWKARAACVVLGWGSIYNHSDNPNSHWSVKLKRLEMVFTAIRDIEVGEQITHDYNWPDDMTKELKRKL